MMNQEPMLLSETVSNETLLTMWYGGDENALGILFGRVWAQLLDAVLRRLPPRLSAKRETAEDLVAETIVKVLATRDQGPAQFRPAPGNSVLNWLYGIVRNQVASFCRTKKGKAIPMSGLTPVNHESEHGAFENAVADHRQGEAHEELENAEKRRQFQAAVRRLPQQDQAILAMRVEGKKSLQEIAEALGVSPSTVCRRLQDIGAALSGQVPELPVHFDSLGLEEPTTT